jgi:hypothetical protein
MASTIAQLMGAIETRLKTIAGLNTSAYVADQINPPQAIVAVPPIPNYHETMQRGYVEYEFEITVLVSGVLDQKSQYDLASYADVSGVKSVINAIYGDKQLGGLAEDCILIDFRPLNNEEVGLIGYRGGLFHLKVAAKGS